MNVDKGVRELIPVVPGMYTGFLPTILQDKARVAFTYNGDFLPLAVGATATDVIAIQADSHFLITSYNAEVRTDVVPPVLIPGPALTVQIEDQGSGRNFQNRATAYENIFGTAQLPGILSYPFLIQRNGAIATTIANNQGVAVQIRYSFAGFKVYPGIPASRFEQEWA